MSVESAKQEEERCSSHSDTGLVTILNYGTGGPGGLEVKPRGSEGWMRISWESMPKDALVVNIGDSLHLLSNGRFKSTVHRVRLKPSTQDRFVALFFFAPNYDSVLIPHTSHGEREKFQRIVAGKITHNYLSSSMEDRALFDQFVEGGCRSKQVGRATAATVSMSGAAGEPSISKSKL